MPTIINRARSFMQEKNYSEALKLLYSIPEEYLSSEACILRAICLQLDNTEDGHDLKDVQNELSKAIEINPRSIESNLEMGYFLYAVMDNSKTAQPYFQKVVELLGDFFEDYEDLKNEIAES